MKYIIFCMLLCSFGFAYGQQTNITIIVKNSETQKPLPSATVSIISLNISRSTDKSGVANFSNIPDGKYAISFSHIGFETRIDTLLFPLPASEVIIELQHHEEENLDEVVVQSTRTRRSIANTPTRIEILSGEELDEKSNMRPANVRILLHESTGIQMQQTSATTGNASIRVQGLDGRYTQLLKDGYPNFGNFANGLSVLEIPPLDLKQVEVIKGPASTLYGGGAIAGVVNFISKTPDEKPEYNFLINQSNIGQTNIGAYASQRKEKFGYSMLGLFNFQKPYDVDKDDFSELPKSKNFTIHPRLFFYPNESLSVMLGNDLTKSDIFGGDMKVIQGNGDANHTYFENNATTRNTTTLELDKTIAANKSLQLKQAFSLFNRKIKIPAYDFEGINTNAYTDLSYTWNTNTHTVITGINFVYDNFKNPGNISLNAKTVTRGVYAQHTWSASDIVQLENGLRIDNATYTGNTYTQNQIFILPRFSALFKINSKLSSRVGGGLGYKMPTIFTEQTETIHYQNVEPLMNVHAERSIGGTADVNYKTNIGDDFAFSINQMFFYTQINKPLVLKNNNESLYFANASQPILSNGFETNMRLVFKNDIKFFGGYTFTNAHAKYRTGNQFMPLLPKHKVNLVLMYEKHNNFKFGVEGYFTDTQYLYSGSKTHSFWEFGFMAEKTLWDKFSIYMNFENFTDTRQSRYKPVVNGTHTHPVFDDIWTHTEGFIWNGGIKIKL